MRVITGEQVWFVETRNLFGIELPSQVPNVSYVSRILKHNYILSL